jgi:hypothetical protein
MNKGGIILENFSLWLNSPKKSAKSLLWALTSKEKMHKGVIWPFFWRFGPKWKTFWDQTTFSREDNLKCMQFSIIIMVMQARCVTWSRWAWKFPYQITSLLSDQGHVWQTSHGVVLWCKEFSMHVWTWKPRPLLMFDSWDFLVCISWMF